MELIERDGFFDLLQAKFETVSEGEGHCVFVSGEAGIGKTSLIKTFCKASTNTFRQSSSAAPKTSIISTSFNYQLRNMQYGNYCCRRLLYQKNVVLIFFRL